MSGVCQRFWILGCRTFCVLRVFIFISKYPKTEKSIINELKKTQVSKLGISVFLPNGEIYERHFLEKQSIRTYNIQTQGLNHRVSERFTSSSHAQKNNASLKWTNGILV